jgi:hypothetical protein
VAGKNYFAWVRARFGPKLLLKRPRRGTIGKTAGAAFYIGIVHAEAACRDGQAFSVEFQKITMPRR